MKDACDGLIRSGTGPSGAPVSLKTWQQQLPKLKSKEKKTGKKFPQNIQELWDTYESCNVCVMEHLKGKGERKEQKKYLKNQ